MHCNQSLPESFGAEVSTHVSGEGVPIPPTTKILEIVVSAGHYDAGAITERLTDRLEILALFTIA